MNSEKDDLILLMSLLIDSISRDCRTPETYIIIAKGFMTKNQWEDGAKLFVDAKETGCLSEELGLMTMEAVAARTTKGKIRILRSIASEIAEVSGMETHAWISTRYWGLKHRLGFHYARLLMWWNDPNESPSKELELAMQHFYKSKRNGTLVKNDVLRCIVKLVGDEVQLPSKRSSNSKTLYTQKESNKVPDKENAIAVMLSALSEARRTTLGVDRMFSFEVARGLHRLGANKECIAFVHDLIEQGARWNRTMIEQAIFAAEAENDTASLQKFKTLLSKNPS